jgi:hypothetical protein
MKISTNQACDSNVEATANNEISVRIYFASTTQNNITENDFQGAFEAWKKRWGGCIRSQRDYFEGNSSQKLSKLSQKLFFLPIPGTKRPIIK